MSRDGPAMSGTPTHLAAIVAAGLVLATGAYAWRQSTAHEAHAAVAPDGPPSAASGQDGADADRLCAIYHARFGGTRARLVRMMRDDIANFVVIELSRGERVAASVQRAWLRASYGEGEPVWLGEFASPESALAKAVRLCPQAARCERGTPGCGPEERPFTALPTL